MNNKLLKLMDDCEAVQRFKLSDAYDADAPWGLRFSSEEGASEMTHIAGHVGLRVGMKKLLDVIKQKTHKVRTNYHNRSILFK